MTAELSYITLIENNLSIYEARVKAERTVSEKLKNYIERKKDEIRQMKNQIMGKADFIEMENFDYIQKDLF